MEPSTIKTSAALWAGRAPCPPIGWNEYCLSFRQTRAWGRDDALGDYAFKPPMSIGSTARV
jgi:hypothetical protein